jgi:hypothetical protein
MALLILAIYFGLVFKVYLYLQEPEGLMLPLAVKKEELSELSSAVAFETYKHPAPMKAGCVELNEPRLAGLIYATAIVGGIENSFNRLLKFVRFA